MYRQSWSATTCGSSASSVPPETSLMICAPSLSAAAATDARVVSMDSTAPAGINVLTAPVIRASSSASDTRLAPGRVDSAPMSMISAPAAIMSRPCWAALAGSSHRPPSEDESSVMLSTPITMVCVASCNACKSVIGHLPFVVFPSLPSVTYGDSSPQRGGLGCVTCQESSSWLRLGWRGCVADRAPQRSPCGRKTS